jgi:mono/diheme cytochrome c family protein
VATRWRRCRIKRAAILAGDGGSWHAKRIAGLLLAVALAGSALLSGCRLDMHDQPKFKPLRISDFYADRRSSRPLVEGTIARGHLSEDTYFYTGLVNGQPANYMPFAATREVLDRGRERFNIYCAPCHARTGDGNGIIVQRGYRRPPSFHLDRLRQAPLGHFFDVMSNGFGAMPDYAAQVAPADRWAIIAYIRALQLSQNASEDMIPSGEREKMSQPGKQAPGGGATPPAGGKTQ